MGSHSRRYANGRLYGPRLARGKSEKALPENELRRALPDRVGRARPLFETDHCGLFDSAGLGFDPRLFQLLFGRDLSPSILGVRSVLVFFTRRPALAHSVLRLAQTHVAVCFRA